MEFLEKFLEGALFKSVCSAVIILVIGVLVIRIVMKLLKTTLEKSRLEKAAHTLITSLAKAAMYILLCLQVHIFLQGECQRKYFLCH